jgi:hypothetical protein
MVVAAGQVPGHLLWIDPRLVSYGSFRATRSACFTCGKDVCEVPFPHAMSHTPCSTYREAHTVIHLPVKLQTYPLIPRQELARRMENLWYVARLRQVPPVYRAFGNRINIVGLELILVNPWKL